MVSFLYYLSCFLIGFVAVVGGMVYLYFWHRLMIKVFGLSDYAGEITIQILTIHVAVLAYWLIGKEIHHFIFG